MYILGLNCLHVKFELINNFAISCHRKYGLNTYYKLGAGFAFARQHHRVLVVPSSKARFHVVYIIMCFRYAE